MRKLTIFFTAAICFGQAPSYDANTANPSNTTQCGARPCTTQMGSAGSTINHLIVACVSVSANPAIIPQAAITDTVGTTYTKVQDSVETGSTGGTLETFWGCAAGTNASNTLSWNDPGGAGISLVTIAVAQYSNVPCGTNPVDQQATFGTGAGSGSVANSVITSAATPTTTVANELLLGCMRKYNSAPTLSAGTSPLTFTMRTKYDSNRDGVGLEDNIQTSTGTFNATATTSSNTNWTIQLTTFKGIASSKIRHQTISGKLIEQLGRSLNFPAFLWSGN